MAFPFPQRGQLDPFPIKNEWNMIFGINSQRGIRGLKCFFNESLLIRVVVAFSCVVVTLLLAFVYVQGSSASWFVKSFGYWIALALILLTLLYCRVSKPLSCSDGLGFLRTHSFGVFSVTLVCLLVHWGKDERYDVLFDEYVIGATALNLHLSGECHMGVLSESDRGRSITTDLSVDKRPVMFPVLLSCLHSAFGFNPYNVFVLNRVLTVVLFFLIYGLGVSVANRHIAVLCVLLFGSLPLLGFSAVSGGYELLNLCGIVGLLWTGFLYFRSGSSHAMNRMVICSVFLSCCRYESIAYVLVPVFFVLVRWIRDREVVLPWITALSPLWLVLPLASNRVFFADEGFFQTDVANFWGLEHLSANALSNFRFLFDFRGDYAGSGYWTVLVLCSLVLFCVRSVLMRNRWGGSIDWMLVWMTVFLFSFGNTIAASSIYWGAWTDPMTSRFSLPIHLTLTIGLTLYLRGPSLLLRRSFVWIGIFVMVILGMLGSSRYSNARRMLVANAYGWLIDESAHVDRQDSMIVSEGRLGYYLYGYLTESSVRSSFQSDRMSDILESGLLEDGVIVAETILSDHSDRDLFQGYRYFRDSDFLIEWNSHMLVREDIDVRLGKLVGVRSPVPPGGYWNGREGLPDMRHVGGRSFQISQASPKSG